MSQTIKMVAIKSRTIFMTDINVGNYWQKEPIILTIQLEIIYH